MSTWPKIATMGTIKIPPAMPSIPPSALAPSDTANSQIANPLSILRVSRSRSRSRSSSQPGDEPDLIPAVVELFVIDRPSACRVRCPFDQKNWATRAHFECPRHGCICRYGFKPIIRFRQWRAVFLFEQSKDGFGFQIVFHDPFADFSRQISLVER